MRDLGGPGERHAPEVRRSGARVSRSRKFKLTHYPKNGREKSVISIATEKRRTGIVKLLEKLAPAS